MSHIHEALKKAQKERDIRYYPYGSVLGRSGGKTRSEARNTVRRLLPALVLVFILLGIYFLFNPPARKIEGPAEPALLDPSTRSGTGKELQNLYHRAGDYFKKGRFQEAEKLYTELLDSDPGFIDALNNLGVIHLRNRDFDMAKRCLEKAIRLKPVYPEPYYNLACLYAIQGDREQGLNYLKKAISLDKNVRKWALNDTDLLNLRGLPEFDKMTAHKKPLSE